jgi:hypothetical protein
MNDVRRLGRYVLGREIGRGERGAVFEATEPGAGRTLAIKLFRIDIAADPDAYVRALGRSVLAVSGLRHPGVVRLLDQGVATDGQPWVASERPDARSLRQLLDVLPRMSFEWVRSIGLQVADALACAHAAGVVHGGLKASNILIDGDGRVSVTDFGLPVPSPDALPAMPQYLAPEQVQGLAPDARSDVFSLGALMFEMLAGRPPFGSPLTGSLATVLENIAHAPTPTPSALDPEVPPDLDIVVMRSLAKSPVDRYADAGALAAALRGAVVDAAVAPARAAQEAAQPAPRVEEASPPYRRGRSGKPAAPVEDVLAELAADIDAFSARGTPDVSIAPTPAGRPAARSGRESAPAAVAFPTLTDVPVPRPATPPVTPAAHASAPVTAAQPVAASSSLLADLAGEAQRIRAHAMQMQRGEQAARSGAEQALSQRLMRVRDYFTQLSAQLNVIRPQVARDYPLLGLGVLRGLSWLTSDVNTRQRGAEAPDQLARVSLSWLLRGQSVLRCERDALSADALRAALKEHGLRFEEQPSRDDYGRLRAQVFDVAPEVRGRAELVADFATLTLRLTLQNVERFGVVDYTPPADDAGNEWLDELVRLLLGQPSRFPTLARLIVPSAG